MEGGEDISGILKKRRGLRGKDSLGRRVTVVIDLGEEKRRKREKAVKKKSGSKEMDFLGRWV